MRHSSRVRDLSLASSSRGGYSALAQLQGTDIGGDAPPIVHRDARGIAIHCAVTVRHNVEKMSDWRVHQPLVQIAGRLAQSARHDHAVAVAEAPWQGETVNIESLLAALHSACNLNRKVVYILAVDFARVARLIDMQLAARHRVRDRRPRGLPSPKKSVAANGL